MERKLAFIFDHNKCIICNACVDACNKAYGNLNWRKLIVLPMGNVKTALSISCNHCDDPKCMEVCPASAFEKNDMGIVTINKDKCIGCGFCSWACPYEALTFDKEGTMTKCTFCEDRILTGKGIPYCVEACPTGALAFGWVDKGEADVSYLAPPTITNPMIVIRKPKEGKIKANVIHEKKEENYISLLLFTILSEFALGYSLFKLPQWDLVSLISLIIGLLPAITHAKVRKRAYRVVFNLKSSWLSREVLFGGLSILFYLLGLRFSIMYYPALASLALAVLSSIMIYMLKSRPSWYSADTPVSFIGSIFSLSLPLAYYFGGSVFFLIGIAIVSAVEIITSFKKYKPRVYMNISSIILALLSYFFIYAIFAVFIINVVSEINYRRRFYEKVLYYGLPTVL
ncbi:MAG: 4Fe-4S binding protein [Sulfolobaceae archaeon]|nr:4Fe-4S binding protein [Sulfolobaceae archaeon]